MTDQNKIKNNSIYNRVYKGISLLCLFIAGYFLIKWIVYTLGVISISSVFGIPNEYRDMATHAISEIFLKGSNPYTIDGMQTFTTPAICVYGLFSPMLAALISKITGYSVLTADYILNMIYLVSTCFLIFFILKKRVSENNKLLFISVALITATLFTIFRPSPVGLNLRGDSAAIFIFSLILYCMSVDKKPYILIGLLSVLLFFSKQTMIVLILPVLLYIIFFDKKHFLQFFLSLAGFGILAILTLFIFFPTYLTETVVILGFMSWSFDMMKAVDNLIAHVRIYWIFYILIICDVVWECILSVGQCEKTENGFLKFCKKDPYITYLAFNVIIAVGTLLYVAQNGGDAHKYIQEMLTIEIVIWGILSLNAASDKLGKQIKKSDIKPIIISMGLFLISLIMVSNFGVMSYTKENIGQYIDLAEELDKYNPEEMFLGPAVTFYSMNNDEALKKADYDSGHHVLKEASGLLYNITKGFFPVDDTMEVMQGFQKKVNSKIENKEYKIICGRSAIIKPELLEANYKQAETFTLKNDTQEFEVLIYTPK